MAKFNVNNIDAKIALASWEEPYSEFFWKLNNYYGISKLPDTKPDYMPDDLYVDATNGKIKVNEVVIKHIRNGFAPTAKPLVQAKGPGFIFGSTNQGDHKFYALEISGTYIRIGVYGSNNSYPSSWTYLSNFSNYPMYDFTLAICGGGGGGSGYKWLSHVNPRGGGGGGTVVLRFQINKSHSNYKFRIALGRGGYGTDGQNAGGGYSSYLHLLDSNNNTSKLIAEAGGGGPGNNNSPGGGGGCSSSQGSIVFNEGNIKITCILAVNGGNGKQYSGSYGLTGSCSKAFIKDVTRSFNAKEGSESSDAGGRCLMHSDDFLWRIRSDYTSSISSSISQPLVASSSVSILHLGNSYESGAGYGGAGQSSDIFHVATGHNGADGHLCICY